jgi:hypothetical protein
MKTSVQGVTVGARIAETIPKDYTRLQDKTFRETAAEISCFSANEFHMETQVGGKNDLSMFSASLRLLF